MPESQKLPKNATLAFKETHKKHSDTLESEALVDGARYSNKQISTATQYEIERKMQKTKAGKQKRKRSKTLSNQGQFARVRLLNSIVDKIREMRVGNSTLVAISNTSCQQNIQEANLKVTEAANPKHEYSNVLQNISGLQDEKKVLYNDYGSIPMPTKTSLKKVQSLRNQGKTIDEARDRASFAESRARSTSNNKIFFTYSSPTMVEQHNFMANQWFSSKKESQQTPSQGVKCSTCCRNCSCARLKK